MAVVSLKAIGRTPDGKGGARRTRRDGLVPAVLYGIGDEPQTLSLDAKEIEIMFRQHGGSSIILELDIAGGSKTGVNKALVKEVQRDTVSGQVLHMDLQAVSATRKLTVDVPVVVLGEAPGVKEGGVMEVVLRDLQIQCLPADIPDKYEIDVSDMVIGDSVHVGDLSIPNAEILNDPGNVVMTIVPPTVYEEPVVEEEAVEGEPEVVGEEKEEAEAEEKGEDKGTEKEKE
jgi:large subunit ribosomal protein L25